MDSRRLPVPPGPCPTPLAVRAWNLMGGLDWAALPVVLEILGIDDPEPVIHQLATLRDHGRDR